MKCPVCGSDRFASTCPDCGYDRSRDYEQFPTFGPVKNARSRAGLHTGQAPEDALHCEKCGGASFVIRVPDGTRRCSRCGWSPDEIPILRCTCGSAYFTARLSDGALMCPLCRCSVPLEDFLKALQKPKAPAPAPEPPVSKSLPASPKERPRTAPIKPVITALAAGDAHTVALFSDGTVRAIGSNEQGQCDVSSWSEITAIAAGSNHTVGLRRDGTVVAAGAPSSKHTALGDWRGVTAIAAGCDFTLGLCRDGTLRAAGSSRDTRSMAGAQSITAGSRHMAAIRSGTVVSDAYTPQQLRNWNAVTAVALGANHIVGLNQNGAVLTAGANDYGQCFAAWSGIRAIAAGHAHTVALRKNGTVVAAGYNRSGQCNVAGWFGVAAIAAGSSHTVALKSDGSLLATGDNSCGQCDVEKLYR